MDKDSPHNRLENKVCTTCRAGVDPLSHDQILPFLEQISPDWYLVENHHIQRIFTFKNFRQALEFTNRIGEIAEFLGHHPDIYLSWGKVKVEIWTHKINGLHENDFILAKKIDDISH